MAESDFGSAVSMKDRIVTLKVPTYWHWLTTRVTSGFQVYGVGLFAAKNFPNDHTETSGCSVFARSRTPRESPQRMFPSDFFMPQSSWLTVQK
jgi:hypothetical protein